MQARFYPDGLARAGIALVLPSPAEQAYIHEKYMTELVNGRIVPETRARLLAIAERLRVEEAVEAVILGGTELPLILRPEDAGGVRFLDTTRLHVERMVAEILS
jgi:aspartate racemase